MPHPPYGPLTMLLALLVYQIHPREETSSGYIPTTLNESNNEEKKTIIALRLLTMSALT